MTVEDGTRTSSGSSIVGLEPPDFPFFIVLLVVIAAVILLPGGVHIAEASATPFPEVVVAKDELDTAGSEGDANWVHIVDETGSSSPATSQLRRAAAVD